MYEQEIYKLLGENLDSNGTMVLFGDKEVVLEMVSESQATGSIILKSFDTPTEAFNFITPLYDYLDYLSKSHVIVFGNSISLENVIDRTPNPLFYNKGGYSVYFTGYDAAVSGFYTLHYLIHQVNNDILLTATINLIS